MKVTHIRSGLTFGLASLFVIAACALSPATTHAAARDNAGAAPPTTFSFTGVWGRALDLLHHGKVDQARDALEKIAAASSDPDRARVWLDKWLAAEQKRLELTQADYEDYVGRSQKWMGEEDYIKALKWAYWAMLNTADEDEYRRLDWLQKLRERALEKAQKLYDDHEWRDAHALYYSLSLIFEDDQEIDRRRQDCLEHARLDEQYKSDRDWEESLEGIDQRMVEEAFYRVDRKHVVEANFKDMTLAGYNMILLLADSPTLREQFEGLTGDRGAQFRARLDRKLRQIKAQDELTYREALQYFRRALDINDETAQVPEAIVVREYTDAALEKLDEFTSMIWPYDYREFEKHTRGDFIGVGIQIRNKYNEEIKDTEIVVVSPLEDTPAYRAGILADDVITKVNGESLVGIPVTKAVTKITGPLHTTVNLTIRRTLENGQEAELDIPLRRERVEIQSVKSLQRSAEDEQQWDFVIDQQMGIGYVRINSFQENTVAQLAQALRDAAERGMHGLILDLRYNPGGLLKSAVQMAELFLPEGARIVSTKGLRSREWPVDAETNGQFKDLPLIVLINDSSASASEIVSGAIHDHGRGLVIGERSFGKFSVQNLIRLMHSQAHLKLTTARYYLPSGKSLHREDGSTEWGVEPDLHVPVVPKEESKIIFMRRDADVLGAVKTNAEEELEEAVAPPDDEGEDAEAEEEEELPDPNNRPRRDPQLETALLVMRMHLLNNNNVQMAGTAPQSGVEVEQGKPQ